MLALEDSCYAEGFENLNTQSHEVQSVQYPRLQVEPVQSCALWFTCKPRCNIFPHSACLLFSLSILSSRSYCHDYYHYLTAINVSIFPNAFLLLLLLLLLLLYSPYNAL